MIFIDTNFKLSHLPFIENKLIITKYFYVSYIIKEIILILKKKKIRYKFDRKNIKTKGSLYRILNRIEYKHIDRHTIHFKQTIETSITR